MRVRFLSGFAMAGMLGCLLTTEGCATNWVSEAEQIVAVLIPSTGNLATLVGQIAGTVPAEDAQKIQEASAQASADLELLASLISQYRKADAAAQPELLDRIQAAMDTVQANLGALLPALHIKDAATQAKITAVVGLLLSEAQSMAAIVPLVKPSASPAMMRMAARQVKRQPPLTASEFVVSYNAALTARTGKSEMDRATAGLRIHEHGRLERWASAGLLK